MNKFLSIVLLILWGCTSQTGSILSYEAIELANRSLTKEISNYKAKIKAQEAKDPLLLTAIVKRVDSIELYTASLTNLLISPTFSFSKKQESDLNKHIAIDKDHLFSMLQDYKKLLHSYIARNTRTEFIFTQIDTLFNFDEMADMECTILNSSILLNKILNTKLLLLRYLHSLENDSYFHPWETTVNVKTDASILKTGENYWAHIFMADIDTTVNFTAFLKQGTEYIQLPIEKRRAIFTESTDGLKGQQIREGYIEIETSFQQVKKLPFSLEYYVE